METASPARRVAVELSRCGDKGVTGPLQGHHHEAYAIVLPLGNPLGEEYVRGKLRVRREGLLWFDRRTFAFEDELLMALKGRVSRIPECVEFAEGLFLQGFVEGRTLRDRRFGIGRLSGRHVGQLGELFGQIAVVKNGELALKMLPEDVFRPSVRDGDTAGFLGGLIDFTQGEVYEKNRGEFGSLFDRLGVSAASLNGLRDRASGLTPRPFCLVHGDLHRRNLIVDSRGDLWFIDWELAMIGDPLYDLATHLHLMNYNECDALRVKEAWRGAVEAVCPGASEGWERDLPHLLTFKQAQSVYTDVIRTAVALQLGVGALAGASAGAASPGPGAASPAPARRLARAAWKVQRVLALARTALGLPSVPTRAEIRATYGEWVRRRG
ncbi:phosphotransferase [Streptomyces noboritoensis]|uniref:Phosphotransferase n=1 Tax=Streptomyces noboritoensis TaxID=67337 RepID=A0ABV6TP52_9ACTN